MNASQFVDRFATAYWDDVANNPSEFADHSDTCEESLEELLADVTVDWSQNTPEHLRIEMSNTIGDAWRFVFADNRGTWMLKTATSGSLPYINRVDCFLIPHTTTIFDPFWIVSLPTPNEMANSSGGSRGVQHGFYARPSAHRSSFVQAPAGLVQSFVVQTPFASFRAVS